MQYTTQQTKHINNIIWQEREIEKLLFVITVQSITKQFNLQSITMSCSCGSNCGCGSGCRWMLSMARTILVKTSQMKRHNISANPFVPFFLFNVLLTFFVSTHSTWSVWADCLSLSSRSPVVIYVRYSWYSLRLFLPELKSLDAHILLSIYFLRATCELCIGWWRCEHDER